MVASDGTLSVSLSVSFDSLPVASSSSFSSLEGSGVSVSIVVGSVEIGLSEVMKFSTGQKPGLVAFRSRICSIKPQKGMQVKGHFHYV